MEMHSIITPHYPFQLAITCSFKAEQQKRVWAMLVKAWIPALPCSPL